MLKLTIRSFIPDNFGQILHIDVWKDDTFSDIIARTCQVWQYRLWSFHAEGKKSECFFYKHTQRKLLNF